MRAGVRRATWEYTCGSDACVGSLQGAGMDLRAPIAAMYQFPTIVIFCEGQGIATAKALLETQASEGGLNFPYREDVRMYYRVCSTAAIVAIMYVYADLHG